MTLYIAVIQASTVFSALRALIAVSRIQIGGVAVDRLTELVDLVNQLDPEAVAACVARLQQLVAEQGTNPDYQESTEKTD